MSSAKPQSVTRRSKRHPNGQVPSSTKIAKCSMNIGTVIRTNKYVKK